MDAFDALIQRIVTALPAIGSGAAVIVGFWVGAFVLQALAIRVGRRTGIESVGLSQLLSATIFWVVLGVGVVTGFGTMGINVSALVASLGLTGFAFGFALRDAISNLLAGVLILLYRPFRLGEHIPNQTLYTNPLP